MDVSLAGDESPDFEGCETTLDDLIGGDVRLLQPKSGYRVSMDTVMLAAAVPARPGDRVLEAGAGSAGAALCLAARVAGAKVWGLELQPDMAAFARHNIVLNGKEGDVTIIEGCVTTRPASLPLNSFDHVLANPPYLEAGTAIRPPEITKGLSHMASTARLKDWTRFCIDMVKPKGTLTFIHRADCVDKLLGLLYRQVGDVTVFPLWPRRGVAAKRVIIQARKGVHGAAAILPGLAMHGEVDRYTSAAEAVLRHGKALDLQGMRRQG